MKVLFLNAWGAEAYGPLSEFIKYHASDTDVFCFQEAGKGMPTLCAELLGDYHEITANKFVGENDKFHQTTYVKNDVTVLSSGTVLADTQDVGLGVYVQIELGSSSLYICNFHGVSRPADKHDTPARIRQSQDLIKFFETITGPKIIGGDFNIFPTNPSLQLFQENGYQDLIQDYKITNTRNHLIWDRYPENPKQYYSDYIFVSDTVAVNSFIVPDVEVSDHLPMVLDVTLRGTLVSANQQELQRTL